MTQCISGAELISADEVAEMCGVSRQAVYAWARAGSIPFVQLPGGGKRFRRVDVDAILTPVISVGGQVVAYDASGVA